MKTFDEAFELVTGSDEQVVSPAGLQRQFLDEILGHERMMGLALTMSCLFIGRMAVLNAEPITIVRDAIISGVNLGLAIGREMEKQDFALPVGAGDADKADGSSASGDGVPKG